MSQVQITIEGETWNILSLGCPNEDGLTYAHLSHTTKGANHKNGFYPKQRCDFIDASMLVGA